MKTKHIPATLLLALAASCIVSCSEAKREEISDRLENVGKDVDTVNQETRAAFMHNKESFSERVNQMIEKNRQDLAGLRATAKTDKEDAKLKYEEAIDKLEKKNDELKAKLAEYDYQSEEKWKSFKEEFSHDMDGLGMAINDLFRDNVKDKDSKK